MKDIHIIDNEVLKTDQNNYILSILCLKNGLSFSLYSPNNNKIHNLVYKEMPEKISIADFFETFCTEYQLNNKNFNKVNVQIASAKTSVIPEAFFSTENYKEFFKFNHQFKSTETIKYQLINTSRKYIIYAVEQELLNKIERIFPDANIQNHAASFINYNLKRSLSSEDENGDKMYIQIHDSFADLLIIRNKELYFYNTYPKSGKNDLQFHVLNVFDQLKLSQEKTETIISGFIEQNDIAVIHLKKFIRLLYFESVNRDYNYFYKFQDIMPHYFFNFLNINK